MTDFSSRVKRGSLEAHLGFQYNDIHENFFSTNLSLKMMTMCLTKDVSGLSLLQCPFEEWCRIGTLIKSTTLIHPPQKI